MALIGKRKEEGKGKERKEKERNEMCGLYHPKI